MKPKSQFTVVLYKILAALFVALGMSFSGRTCRKFLKQAEGRQFDVLIVPGVPFDNGKWDMIMKARVLWAKYLYDKGMVRNIIFSGGAVHSAYYECDIMCQYAMALGVPESAVIPERIAEHSTENVYYSYRLALKMGFKSMALASDPLQTKMLRKFTARKVSPEIALLPVIYNVILEIDQQLTEPVIDPEKAHVPNHTALKDRENLHKRLRGTSGSRIDWDIYGEV